MGGLKRRVLVGKLPEPVFDACLCEVSAYARCLLAEVQL